MKADELDRLVVAGKIGAIDRERVRFIVRTNVIRLTARNSLVHCSPIWAVPNQTTRSPGILCPQPQRFRSTRIDTPSCS